MKKYVLIEQDSMEELEKLVNSVLENGGELVGGVSVCRYITEDRKGYEEASWVYLQAVLEADEK